MMDISLEKSCPDVKIARFVPEDDCASSPCSTRKPCFSLKQGWACRLAKTTARWERGLRGGKRGTARSEKAFRFPELVPLNTGPHGRKNPPRNKDSPTRLKNPSLFHLSLYRRLQAQRAPLENSPDGLLIPGRPGIPPGSSCRPQLSLS